MFLSSAQLLNAER